MIPGLVYILCALTSLASGVLLARAASRSGVRLLWWSSLCFFGMTINNALLLVHVWTPKTIALEVPANATALASVLVLLIGLIWDAT